MSKVIDITYNIFNKNTLTVDATVTEDDKISSESGTVETLLLTIYDSNTKEVLQKDSVTGVLPLKVSVEVYFADLDGKGASCTAVANRKPVAVSDAETLQNDETRKQQEINIEKLQDLLTVSGSYTMASRVETGHPTACSVSKTKFMIQPDTDYKLAEPPENASLLFAAGSAEAIAYPGEIRYGKKAVSFPDKWEIGNNRNVPLPLTFHCDMTLQKAGKPVMTRVATLTFSLK